MVSTERASDAAPPNPSRRAKTMAAIRTRAALREPIRPLAAGRAKVAKALVAPASRDDTRATSGTPARHRKEDQWACKPDSVPSGGLGRRRRPSLWAPHRCDARAAYPGVRTGRAPFSPIRPCSGWGLHGRPVSRTPVRSYRTISPLPVAHGRYVSVALSVGSRRPGVTWHPCPVESGLSSLQRLRVAARPPGPLIVSSLRPCGGPWLSVAAPANAGW